MYFFPHAGKQEHRGDNDERNLLLHPVATSSWEELNPEAKKSTLKKKR